MSGMKGWVVFGVSVLALAGCVTTGGMQTAPRKQAAAEAPLPETLKACGGASDSADNIFEICGVGPDGAKTKVLPHQVNTRICGPIEVTDELKAFFCQNADAMFNALNPYKPDPVIAAGFPGKTRAYYSKDGGNGIHYLAPGGKGYFWLANQRNVLIGEWMVYRNQQVCYAVPGLTEHAGTKWRCGPIRAAGLAEIAEGDVLGLAKRGGKAAPWVMQAQPRVTLAEAQLRIESMPSKKNDEPSAEPPATGPSAPVPADPLGPMVTREQEKVALRD